MNWVVIGDNAVNLDKFIEIYLKREPGYEGELFIMGSIPGRETDYQICYRPESEARELFEWLKKKLVSA